MLLSSLSILIGAILVPPEYVWLYSTHIILVCLYLICTKRLLVISLTFLSFISLYLNELLPVAPFSIQKGQYVLVDVKAKKICVDDYLTSRFSSFFYGDAAIGVEYFTTSEKRKTLYNFTLVFPAASANIESTSPKSSVLKQCSNEAIPGIVTQVTLPDRSGPWWQKALYIKRQDALLNVHFSEEALSKLNRVEKNLRDRFSNKLDQHFSKFDSWRFTKALLLGDDGLWSERDIWMIRTLGLAHLFVVSGLHAGFVFLIGRCLSFVVWRFCPDVFLLRGASKWHFDAITIIPLLWLYAYITDWGEPVVRAAIMLSAYLFSKIMALKFSAYDIITFALWLVLLFNPRSILSPGLWLSFSMVYLLVGFYKGRVKLSGAATLQVMLSTASMVLILGWQESISSVSILINILLIPVAALIWFPLSAISALEALLFNTSLLYSILSLFFDYVLSLLEWLAFQFPLLMFTNLESSAFQLAMILLLVLWVFQSPLRKGWVGVLFVWLALFVPMIPSAQAYDLRLSNNAGQMILSNSNEVLYSDHWEGDPEITHLERYLPLGVKGRFLISPSDQDSSPLSLLKGNVDWVIFKRRPPIDVVKRLDALKVEWLLVMPNQNLEFYFSKRRIDLRHSACIYSFFLFKSDTCKRVEKLKSVLNYL